jgi:Domain of unknown function (DUF3854)
MTLPDTTRSRDYIILKGRVGEDYARELVVESAIDPAVALERGYWVAMERGKLKDLGFTHMYRRIEVPALVIPRRSPDGETTRYQIKPRVPMQTEWGKYLFPPHEEMIVDVHPRSLENLKDPSVPLWVTEGSKGRDSLVSQGLCAVALAGVYNFAVKGTHSQTLLPCWDHINLESRMVIVAYDADAQSSEHVQEALNRLVNRLAERGARVLVTYIPPVGGDGKAGVDDFLADGGRPHDLLAQAVPFVPMDVSHQRLARDPVLKENIEVMEACLLGENWSRRGVARKVLKALILTSRRQGMMWEKPFLAEDGSRYNAQCILMSRAYRTLAEDVGVSLSSVTKGIESLEKMGIIQRDRSIPRKWDEPMYFLLLSGLLWDRYKGMECTTSISEISSSHPFVPISQHNLRLRNSSPSSSGRRGVIKGTSKVRQSLPPDARESIQRLGARAEEILDVLEPATREVEYIPDDDLASLLSYSHTKSMRDAPPFKRLQDAGIMDARTKKGHVRLTPEWQDFLKLAQDEGAEDLADERQRERHQRDRAIFKERNEREGAPEEHSMPDLIEGGVRARRGLPWEIC